MWERAKLRAVGHCCGHLPRVCRRSSLSKRSAGVLPVTRGRQLSAASGLTGVFVLAWDGVAQARPPHKQRQGAPPDWEDPAVFGRHRLPSHVPLHSFADPTQARLFWQQHKGSAAARYDAAPPSRLTRRLTVRWPPLLVVQPLRPPALPMLARSIGGSLLDDNTSFAADGMLQASQSASALAQRCVEVPPRAVPRARADGLRGAGLRPQQLGLPHGAPIPPGRWGGQRKHDASSDSTGRVGLYGAGISFEEGTADVRL